MIIIVPETITMLKKIQFLQGVDVLGASADSATARHTATKASQDPLEVYIAEMLAAMAADAEAVAPYVARQTASDMAPVDGRGALRA